MNFVMMFCESEADFARRTDPAVAPEYWGAWREFFDAMAQAGVLVTGRCLQDPDTATTVRKRDAGCDVADGPFADSKEQLGGFCVVDVPDLDTAMHWAEQAPSARTGSVELRPVVPPIETFT